MNFHDFYANGKKNLGRPAIARAMFQEAYKFPSTRYKSLLQLISLDIKSDNLRHARKLINKHLDEYGNCYRFNITRSFLEHEEYNFRKQQSIIYNNMDENNYISSLYSLADVDLQLGNYEDAFYKYYELFDLDENNTKAIFGMIEAKMLEENYDEAQEILTMLDFKQLSNKDINTYRDFRTFLKYYRGKLKIKNITNQEKRYKYMRLFEDDNVSLYKHLEKHKNSRIDHNDGCFLYDLDLVALVNEVDFILAGERPIRYMGNDKYRLNMGRTIGLLGDQKMHDLCVVTVINTKKIITMYPIILSRNFDSEGFGKILLPQNKVEEKLYK